MKKKPKTFQLIAIERIEKLFRQAKTQFRENPVLSDRYVFLARKMAMKYKVGMPSYLKRRVCRHCHRYLVPGQNCRVRLQSPKVVYTCLECGKLTRLPYIREKKASGVRKPK